MYLFDAELSYFCGLVANNTIDDSDGLLHSSYVDHCDRSVPRRILISAFGGNRIYTITNGKMVVT